ncbi:enolase 4 isoform X2 [Brachyhypopomus gauderio]|uniref:enolase 4 isoform X2 n=1 Tax=Brachyhypopomus gauderio TaxID=698409 RepID=UPI004040F402
MSFKRLLNCNSRTSKEDREFYNLKNKAAEYYRANGIPQKIEAVLNEMFYEKPNDVYGYLANRFSGSSLPPVISAVTGRAMYDARGGAALQADVYCVIRDEEKLVCSAVITDVDDDVVESEDVVANGNHQQVSVATALKWIREHLRSMLHGFNPAHQTHLDNLLSDFLLARYLEDQDARNRERENEEEKSETKNNATPPPTSAPTKDKKGGDKGKKVNSGEKLVPPPEPAEPVLPGAMAVAAVSLAAAKSAASLTTVPLYKYMRNLRDQAQVSVPLPTPLLTLLSCGKTSAGKLNLLEEIILLPTAPYTARQIIEMGFEVQREIKRITAASKMGPAVLGVSGGGAVQLSLERAEQALDLVMEACKNLGLPIGSDLRLALNCAAHALMDYPRGKYEVMAGCLKSPDELVDVLTGLVSKYPAITALIDPFRREDVEQWRKLSSLIGQSCCLIADRAYCPLPRCRETKPLPPGVTWVTLRHRSEMTLTDLLHAVTDQREGETILAIRGDEIGDDSLVDVAVGLGVSFLKLGGMSGGSRMNKFNRLLSIETELEEQGILEMREINLTQAATELEESDPAHQVQAPPLN